MAMGKSNAVPFFGVSAGQRLIVILLGGTVNPELHIHANPCLVDVEDGAPLDDLVFNGIVVDEAGGSIKKTGPGRVVFNELSTLPVEIAGGGDKAWDCLLNGKHVRSYAADFIRDL